METAINSELINKILQPRKKDAHKGQFGHSLIIAGSKGKMGAAILASRACLRSGVGLLTTHVPSVGMTILQIAVPEAMLSLDENPTFFSDIPEFRKYKTIAIGPGIGIAEQTQKAMLKVMNGFDAPIVIDADGLNCLSLNKDWFRYIPENSILTPHVKEFERLVGSWSDEEEKIQKLTTFSKENKCIVVLKGPNTLIATTNGDMYVNSTGNPGMAKGGSGDVLTGMITSFLSQSYPPVEAAILGVYLHGSAGDIAVIEKTEFGLLATDLIEFIPSAIKEVLVK